MLTRACLLIIITQFLGLILFAVFFFVEPALRNFEEGTVSIIFDVVVTLIIRFIVYIYFMGITSQWVVHLQY